MTKQKKELVSDEETLDGILKNVDMNETTELGEVTKEFSENKPSSSNLSDDEFRLTWRAKSILRRLSPKSVIIIDDFVDGKRSVGGWNTEQKVAAITGVQQQRQGVMGKFMDKMFTPKQ